MKKIILLGSILLLSPMYGNIIEYAEQGNLKGIQECIRNGANVNAKDNKGQTSVMWGSHNNQIEMVKYL